MFNKLLTKFTTVATWNSQTLHDEFANAQNEIGKLDMQLLRVLITGVAGGPQLFDLLALIGKDESLNRLNHAINSIPFAN